MSKNITRYIALLFALILIATTGGVWATWKYTLPLVSDVETDLPLELDDFVYIHELPEGEVSFLERLNDVLNNRYSNDTIPEDESMSYLLSTIDKDWDSGHNPTIGSFVGSMDPTNQSKLRIEAMFGDIIDLEHVSFILKSEDLVGSVDDEICIYSTSDPLVWTPGNWLNSVVGVYLTVFVPIVDEQGVTVGYEQLCDSLHGYCMEVQYMEGDLTPSFSTDHWRDELFYWHENYTYPIPITGEDRYKYECYHPADGNYAYPGRTVSWSGWINVQTNQWATGDYVGKKAWQCLAEIVG